MRRRTTILIAIVVVLLIGLGIVWETVPYVRYQLIPVTGGTQAPQSFSLLQRPDLQGSPGGDSNRLPMTTGVITVEVLS